MEDTSALNIPPLSRFEPSHHVWNVPPRDPHHPAILPFKGIIFQMNNSRTNLKMDFQKSIAVHSKGTVTRFHPTSYVLACGSKTGIHFFVARIRSRFVEWVRSRNTFSTHVGRVKQKVTALEWNADGKLLAAGCHDGNIVAWNFPDGTIILQQKITSVPVSQLEWNILQGYLLASLHKNHKQHQLIIWKAKREETNKHVHLFDRQISRTRISKAKWIDDKKIALGLLIKCEIEIWSISQKGHPLHILKFNHCHANNSDYGYGITDMIWMKDTKCLIACSFDGWIEIWNTDDYNSIHQIQVASGCLCLSRQPVQNGIPGHANFISARQIKEKFFFACGLNDGSIVYWNPLIRQGDSQMFQYLSKHKAPVIAVSFTQDESLTYLVSADKDCEVILWVIYLGTFISSVSFGTGNVCGHFSWSIDTKVQISSHANRIQILERIVEETQEENRETPSTTGFLILEEKKGSRSISEYFRELFETFSQYLGKHLVQSVMTIATIAGAVVVGAVLFCYNMFFYYSWAGLIPAIVFLVCAWLYYRRYYRNWQSRDWKPWKPWQRT